MSFDVRMVKNLTFARSTDADERPNERRPSERRTASV